MEVQESSSQMGMLGRLKAVGRRINEELAFYRAVLGDPRTPWLARLLLGLAVGYALLPFDLIPDFIPIIGHLDDLIVVPALIVAALKLIPSDVIEECRRGRSHDSPDEPRVDS